MKKRYMVTLDQESTERCKQAIKQMGMAPNQFSRMLSDSVEIMAPLLEEMANSKENKRKMNISSLLLKTIVSDQKLDCNCGWSGDYDDTADDGPGNEICCPKCGTNLLTQL